MKIPISVLVVIYTAKKEVLLLERADHPGYWQSVTGSLDAVDEPLAAAAAREVFEETGIQLHKQANAKLIDLQYHIHYEIYPEWRHRYAPGVTQNLEHWFALELDDRIPITLSPREHLSYQWLPLVKAADLCFSPSNQAAIKKLNSD